MQFDNEEHINQLASELAASIDENPLLWDLAQEAMRNWLDNDADDPLEECLVDWFAELLAYGNRLDDLVGEWLRNGKLLCPVCRGERTVEYLDSGAVHSGSLEPPTRTSPCPLCG